MRSKRAKALELRRSVLKWRYGLNAQLQFGGRSSREGGFVAEKCADIVRHWFPVRTKKHGDGNIALLICDFL